MKVHRELGPELLEKYYQRAVEKELQNKKIAFRREFPVDIFYENQKIGKYYLDFLIENKIVLELKARKNYSTIYYKQVLAYLRQLNLSLGIVVNFRSLSLKPERVINSRYNSSIRINSHTNSDNSQI